MERGGRTMGEARVTLKFLPLRNWGQENRWHVGGCPMCRTFHICSFRCILHASPPALCLEGWPMWLASLGLLLASSYVQLMRDQQEIRELAERESAVSPHHLLLQVGRGCIHPTKAATRWAALPGLLLFLASLCLFSLQRGTLQLIPGCLTIPCWFSWLSPFLPGP